MGMPEPYGHQASVAWPLQHGDSLSIGTCNAQQVPQRVAPDDSALHALCCCRSVVLVRMLKDVPTCGKPGAAWVVEIKGQVKRALDKWALDLQNTLFQHRNDADLVVYKKKLEPLHT